LSAQENCHLCLSTAKSVTDISLLPVFAESSQACCSLKLLIRLSAKPRRDRQSTKAPAPRSCQRPVGRSYSPLKKVWPSRPRQAVSR
jgi:hypothetical protein